MRVGYLPAELATQQTRHKLGEIFPRIKGRCIRKDNSITNDENPSGWFDYEAGIDAPATYLNTNEGQLFNLIKSSGRRLLSLNEYIVAGQDSKLFTGHYLDVFQTSVRLGSRDIHRLVSAEFYDGDGILSVVEGLHFDYNDPHLGARTSRAKKSSKKMG